MPRCALDFTLDFAPDVMLCLLLGLVGVLRSHVGYEGSLLLFLEHGDGLERRLWGY